MSLTEDAMPGLCAHFHDVQIVLESVATLEAIASLRRGQVTSFTPYRPPSPPITPSKGNLPVSWTHNPVVVLSSAAATACLTSIVTCQHVA